MMDNRGLLRWCPVVFLIFSLATVSACVKASTSKSPADTEATQYQNVNLTPILQQRNNAIEGTQHIDAQSYHLVVNGMVQNQLSLSYSDLQSLPQVSKLATLNCVEGWNFTAKWTGPSLKSIFDMAGVLPGASVVIFHTADDPDGFTSLDYSYIIDNDIIIAMKLNDVTMPADRGFPFQVVAEGKYGYKWAKWVTGIELSDNTNFRGYWENAGYNNDATVGGPAYESP